MSSITEISTGTVRVTASYDFYAEQRGEGRVAQSVDFTIMATDAAELDAIVSLFPKSARLHRSSVSTHTGGGVWIAYPLALTHIKLLADGVNGGRNETGIKRVHSILRAAAKAGLAVDFAAYAGNSFDSLAELLTAIDGDVELAQVVEQPAVEQPAVGVADFDELSRAAETRELAVGSRVRRVLDGKIGEVVKISGPYIGVEIDGEVWQGTRAAWVELCADCDEPCGFGHFGMHCVDCSGDALFIAERDARDAALIEQAAVAELDAHVCDSDTCCAILSDSGWQRDGQPVDIAAVLAETSDRATVAKLHGDDVAELVAERYPSALPLLAGGWTVDAAIAHVDGTCDRELCTGEHDEPVADYTTREQAAVDALRALGWNSEQIDAAFAARARVAAVDNPPAHAVGCGCMTCEAARAESATLADRYAGAHRTECVYGDDGVCGYCGARR